jgi:hypothetical protein
METISQNDEQLNTDDQTSESDRIRDILNFRDELLAREILACGVGKSDELLHLGSGFSENLIFSYISDLKLQNIVPDLSVSYTAVDVDKSKLEQIESMNSRLESPLDVHFYNESMQSFLDTDSKEFKWTLITGLFDTKLYEDKQFEFIDKIVNESLKRSSEGVILTFDAQKKVDDTYTVQHIISYIESVYSRYRVSRINEYNYVICINKYYHSITQ